MGTDADDGDHLAGQAQLDLLNDFEPAPRTIIHGDFRLDNMFFDHPDGSPLAVIDWQISNRGRGIFDVAYFLCSSLEGDVRKEHEMRLLHLWHDIVIDGGAQAYSFDQALYDYRAGILLCNVVLDSFVACSTDQGVRLAGRAAY